VAVAFLTTRVKGPDEDDWGKIKRVLKYLKGTKDLVLTLSADDLNIIRWYIDASFAAHEDCKGHTGAMMTMGVGAAISFSRKHRINARSSTEGEIIGIFDALPSVLHCKYFLEALGYAIKKNVIYQDNKSTITLAKNGKASSSKRTKHIKVRYFFIKDCIDRGEVEMEHCPTKEMWSDVLTKPKQGREFFLMRSKLMGCPMYLNEGDAVENEGAAPKILKTMAPSRAPLQSLGNLKGPMTEKGQSLTSQSMQSLRGCVGRNVKWRETIQETISIKKPTRGKGLGEPSRATLLAMCN
jgi:hypothetical protein